MSHESDAATHRNACLKAWAAHVAKCTTCLAAIESGKDKVCDVGQACQDELRTAEQHLITEEARAMPGFDAITASINECLAKLKRDLQALQTRESNA